MHGEQSSLNGSHKKVKENDVGVGNPSLLGGRGIMTVIGGQIAGR